MYTHVEQQQCAVAEGVCMNAWACIGHELVHATQRWKSLSLHGNMAPVGAPLYIYTALVVTIELALWARISFRIIGQSYLERIIGLNLD